MKRGTNHNLYHKALPEAAQADLRRAAAESYPGSAKRAVAVAAAVARVRAQYPEHFKQEQDK